MSRPTNSYKNNCGEAVKKNSRADRWKDDPYAIITVLHKGGWVKKPRGSGEKQQSAADETAD